MSDIKFEDEIFCNFFRSLCTKAARRWTLFPWLNRKRKKERKKEASIQTCLLLCKFHEALDGAVKKSQEEDSQCWNVFLKSLFVFTQYSLDWFWVENLNFAQLFFPPTKLSHKKRKLRIILLTKFQFHLSLEYSFISGRILFKLFFMLFPPSRTWENFSFFFLALEIWYLHLSFFFSNIFRATE